MNVNQPLISQDFEVDLAFDGISPDKIDESIDLISRDLLINIDSWSMTFEKWINYIRKDIKLTCPDIVRTNNLLSLGLIFTDDLSITNLNFKWRKKNKSTDVLYFPTKHFINNKKYIGDIAICYEIINKRSKTSNFFLEFDKMWIHGYFHLIGYDHKKLKDFKNMAKKENLVLKYFHKLN